MNTIKSHVTRLAMITAMAVGVNRDTSASTITISASQPTQNIKISQLTSDSVEQFTKKATGNWRELGQTFTVTGGGFVLDKISVKFNQPTGYGYLTNGLSLYMTVDSVANTNTFSGTTVTGFPDSGITGSFTTNTDLWMTFDVANASLNPGTYAFRLGFDTAGFSSTYAIGDTGDGIGGLRTALNTDPYGGGRMFRRSGNPPSTISNPENDLVFIIQEVPEPSSAVLLALGGLLALRRISKL